ncbi:hypothetical protein PGT21_031358 [Puccinia graminis f. sp. tritici]|uniref:Uncharacterized protein n=1 Tax=Puccinia graminis f. sp. tritici TaxID=56615 RepID=A0A5B0QBY1_PUCGR|nr:hypothetical protein PGT21_031358 [Puccinia graminis f. sp. tritici]
MTRTDINFRTLSTVPPAGLLDSVQKKLQTMASKTKPIATPRPVSSSPFKIQTPLCPRTIHRDFKIIVTKRDMLGVQLLKNNEKQEASETSTGFYEPI